MLASAAGSASGWLPRVGNTSVFSAPLISGPSGNRGGATSAPPRLPVAALTVIYRFGPCRQRARWRWLTPGAVFAAVLSLTVSFLFSWYLSNFVRTDSYGPLAAFMGFLLWIWLTVQIILMGAELNAEIEHQTAVDTTTALPSRSRKP